MDIPIHVTRETPDGRVGIWSLGSYWLWTFWLTLVSITLWNIVGFVVAWRVLF